MKIYKWRHQKNESKEEILTGQDEIDPQDKVSRFIQDNFEEASEKPSSHTHLRQRKVD